MATPDPSRSVRDAAALYIAKGWRVVPLAPGSKAATDPSWMTLVFKPDDFDEHDNIGIKSLGGLIDVDVDSPEAIACARAFLPPTGCVYGRKTKPAAHWLYTAPFEKTITFKDLNAGEDHKSTLIEVRVNHQSMAPPSVHEDGATLEWEGILSDPATVEPPTLMRAVRLIATCALIGRYYQPPGDRHDWGVALAGFLRHLGVVEIEALQVITEAARWVRDEKLKDRLTEFKSTYAHSDEDPLAGGKALREKMSTGKSFCASLQKIWGGRDAGTGGGFILSEKGDKIAAMAQENLRRALAKLSVEVAYDTFSQKMVFTRNNITQTLHDQHLLELWFEIDAKFHFRPALDFFTLFLQKFSHEKEFHPVRDYLRSLTWDEQSRLDRWLVECGKAGDIPYTHEVGRTTLVAAVRRVMRPGCKFDELLVLESEQGMLKSSALRALCPHEEWFSDDLPLNVDSKQLIERTLGKWIIEAADLSGLRGSQKEHLKAMLSRQVDGPVRLAYARLPVEQPRQFIVVGTTNSHAYLKDDTGNRRFWPVRVEVMNIDKIMEQRDQLWAEAVTRERRGESIRLSTSLYGIAQFQQERRRVEDPWEEILADKYGPEKKWRLAPSEIWNALGIPSDRRDERASERVVATLQRLGFRRLAVRNEEKKVVKGWAREPSEGNHELKFEE